MHEGDLVTVVEGSLLGAAILYGRKNERGSEATSWKGEELTFAAPGPNVYEGRGAALRCSQGKWRGK